MQNPSYRPNAEDVCAVIVAAGRGTRLGADQNKLFLPLAGEPLIAHTVRALTRHGHVGSLVLVTRPEERDDLLRIATDAAPEGFLIRTTDGGAERVHSIENGAIAAPPTATLLLFHDGARPLVSESIVRAVIAATHRHGACLPVLPVVDTVKVTDGEIVGRTIDRQKLALAQTPQGFLAEPFRDAVQQLRGSESPAPADFQPTDDASLYEAIGRPVHTVPGDPLNLKVTRPGDLELAEALLPVFVSREAAMAGTRDHRTRDKRSESGELES